MPLQKSSPCTGAILSLIGAGCALLGFFLPLAGPDGLFTSSEWQLLVLRWQLLAFPNGPLFFVFDGLAVLILALVMLFALVILAASVSACFNILSFHHLTLRRIAAINGLFIQAILSIIVLSNSNPAKTIGPGLILSLLGFLISVIGVFLSKAPHSIPPQQQPASPPFQRARVSVILGLLGSALVLYGVFFLPMLIVSGGIGNPDNIPYPDTEWSVIVHMFFGSHLFLLDAIAMLFALPLLSALLILGTSISFRALSPEMVKWRRIAAIEGLIIQGLLASLTYVLYSISLSPDLG